MATDIDKFIALKNIAEELDDQVLKDMGYRLKEWFDDDEETRRPWLHKSEEYLKLATQVVERKSFPWPDSSNVKFPLLTTAAMQFQARAYPALVPGPNLVTGLVVGADPDGKKHLSADRVGKHMSYQLLYEMQDWEEDMDKMCLMLPIIGCIFKKSYYDPEKGTNCSDIVLPQDFVVDYYAKNLEDASRKSHIIYRNKNKILEKQRAGIYLECDLGQPTMTDKPFANLLDSKEPKLSPATPHKLIECHCWWDLDEDGYEEPYIVTFHYESAQILRIVARFGVKDVQKSADGKKIAKITPKEYFTKFGFIPNPDGSIYDLGFGLLLGGINETVNTLTNQLLDSGTINNLQSGFLGKGIRVRAGNSRFSPGEWKPVDFTGDDIKKHIFPLPTKEPSDVLFKLLETLVTSGKELASIAEIFVGKMPGQNTPATTTMATIEQGLKVFTAIYKRIYRALDKEYKKLYDLNAIHMDTEVYLQIADPNDPNGVKVYKQDYAEGMTVKPNADPNVVSNAQKLMKVQAIGPLMSLGTIDPKWYTKKFLEANEFDDGDVSLAMNYQAPPSPEMQQMQMEGQLKAQDAQQKSQVFATKAQMDMASDNQETKNKAVIANLRAQEEQTKVLGAVVQAKADLHMQAQQHTQELTHKEQLHQQALRHADEMAKVKAAHERAKPQPKAATKK